MANGVLVVGATNRPDMIDAALMRPGRFDRILYVKIRGEVERCSSIVQILTDPLSCSLGSSTRRSFSNQDS